MGLWGAAQAVAAGFGGLAGAASADVLRMSMSVPQAFGFVFLIEALLFIGAAAMAWRIMAPQIAMPRAMAVPGE